LTFQSIFDLTSSFKNVKIKINLKKNLNKNIRTKEMRTILTFFFIFNLLGSSFSQTFENYVEKRKQELKSNGIDTIIIYFKDYCHVDLSDEHSQGCLENWYDSYPKLIFWVKDGVFYKQKFDCNKTYCVEKLKHSRFLKTILKNINLIRESYIKPVEHSSYFGKTSRRTNETNITKFDFTFGNTTFYKIINDYELETKWFDKKTKNNNYKINQKSILKRIKKLVEKEFFYYNFKLRRLEKQAKR